MTVTGPEQRGRVVPAAVVGGTGPRRRVGEGGGRLRRRRRPPWGRLRAEGSAPGVSRGSRLGWGWGSNGDTVLGRAGYRAVSARLDLAVDVRITSRLSSVRQLRLVG